MTESGDRRITVVFRFDDYNRWSSGVATELLALFQEHRIPCTYGVIPFTSKEFSADSTNCLAVDPDTAGKLTDAVRSGLVEVALHGFTHHANAAMPKGRGESEFRGLDYSSQLRMLSAGKRTLESLYHVSVTTFIPPWNSYDENTLRALAELGFKVVSGSRRTQGIYARGRSQELRFLPITCDPGSLRDAVALTRTSVSDPILVVSLHPYDFIAHDRDRGKFTCEFFGGLLSWLAAQTDVATRTLGEAAVLARDIGHRRLEAFDALEASREMTPAFLSAQSPILFYPSTRHTLSMSIVSWGRLILYYVLLTAVTAVLAGLAASLAFSRVKLGSLPRIVRWASVCLLGLYAIFLTVRSRLARNPRQTAVLAGLLGTCLGTWVAASLYPGLGAS